MKKINQVKSFITVKESSNLSPLTVKSYIEALRLFEEIAVNVNKPTSRDAYNFLTHLKERGNKPKSIVQRLSAVREFYKFMDVKFPDIRVKIEKKKITPITDEDIKLLHSRMDPRNKLILDILCCTGLRLSEYIALKRTDFEKPVINIIGKGSKERRVILPSSIRERVLNFCIIPNGEKMLFGNSRQTIQRLLGQYSDVIKKRLHPHLCRHYFASLLLRNGANIAIVRDLLGHASISTTNDYVHQDIDSAMVEGLLNGKGVLNAVS